MTIVKIGSELTFIPLLIPQIQSNTYTHTDIDRWEMTHNDNYFLKNCWRKQQDVN